jgi:hypothetical protein
MTAPKLPEGLEPVAESSRELRVSIQTFQALNPGILTPYDYWEGGIEQGRSDAQAALQALAAEKDSEIAAAYERDHEKAMSEAKRWAEFIPEIRGNYSAESVIALLGNLVTDLRAGEAEDETLLRRCLAQLGRWQGKYGEHNPSWLPPAGDVKLAEDIDSAIALAAKEAK